MKNLSDISLQDVAPSSITRDSQVQAAITGIDPELKLVGGATGEVLILPRIDELPESIVDLLAWQYHCDFYSDTLTLQQKRNLVRDSILWHRKKGTKWAVLKVLENLGLKAELTEWFETGGKPYTFNVAITFPNDPNKTFNFMDSEVEQAIRDAISEAKPVHADIFSLVARDESHDQNHICFYDVCNWEHGQSMLVGTWEAARPDPGELVYVGQAKDYDDSVAVLRYLAWDACVWDCLPPQTSSGYVFEKSYDVECERIGGEVSATHRSYPYTLATFDEAVHDGLSVMEPTLLTGGWSGRWDCSRFNEPYLKRERRLVTSFVSESPTFEIKLHDIGLDPTSEIAEIHVERNEHIDGTGRVNEIASIQLWEVLDTWNTRKVWDMRSWLGNVSMPDVIANPFESNIIDIATTYTTDAEVSRFKLKRYDEAIFDGAPVEPVEQVIDFKIDHKDLVFTEEIFGDYIPRYDVAKFDDIPAASLVRAAALQERIFDGEISWSNVQRFDDATFDGLPLSQVHYAFASFTREFYSENTPPVRVNCVAASQEFIFDAEASCVTDVMRFDSAIFDGPPVMSVARVEAFDVSYLEPVFYEEISLGNVTRFDKAIYDDLPNTQSGRVAALQGFGFSTEVSRSRIQRFDEAIFDGPPPYLTVLAELVKELYADFTLPAQSECVDASPEFVRDEEISRVSIQHFDSAIFDGPPVVPFERVESYDVSYLEPVLYDEISSSNVPMFDSAIFDDLPNPQLNRVIEHHEFDHSAEASRSRVQRFDVTIFDGEPLNMIRVTASFIREFFADVTLPTQLSCEAALPEFIREEEISRVIVPSFDSAIFDGAPIVPFERVTTHKIISQDLSFTEEISGDCIQRFDAATFDGETKRVIAFVTRELYSGNPTPLQLDSVTAFVAEELFADNTAPGRANCVAAFSEIVLSAEAVRIDALRFDIATFDGLPPRATEQVTARTIVYRDPVFYEEISIGNVIRFDSANFDDLPDSQIDHVAASQDFDFSTEASHVGVQRFDEAVFDGMPVQLIRVAAFVNKDFYSNVASQSECVDTSPEFICDAEISRVDVPSFDAAIFDGAPIEPVEQVTAHMIVYQDPVFNEEISGDYIPKFDEAIFDGEPPVQLKRVAALQESVFSEEIYRVNIPRFDIAKFDGPPTGLTVITSITQEF